MPLLQEESVPPREMSAGQVLTGRRTADNALIEYQCTAVPHRRIWSLVSKGEIVNTNGARTKLFLKQFVDRSGNVDIDGLEQELQGHALAEKVFDGRLRVAKTRLVDRSNLIIGYDYIDIVSFDDLLRAGGPEFETGFAALIPRFAEILDALKDAASNIDLPLETHVNFGEPRSLVFPGLDIRNMGLTRGHEKDVKPELYAFDFGLPSIGSVAETSAELLLSVGLLNWGKPLSRFVRGPDIDLLNRSMKHLQPYSDSTAILAVFERENVRRQNQIKAVNFIELVTKQIGIQVIGRRYFDSLISYAKSLTF